MKLRKGDILTSTGYALDPITRQPTTRVQQFIVTDAGADARPRRKVDTRKKRRNIGTNAGAVN